MSKLRAVLLSFFLLFLACSTVQGQESLAGFVRVGLVQGVNQASFELQGDYRLVDEATGQTISQFSDGSWVIRNVNGLCQVQRNREVIGSYQGPIKAQSSYQGTPESFSSDAFQTASPNIDVYVSEEIFLADHEKELERSTMDGLAVENAEGKVSFLDSSVTEYSVISRDGVTQKSKKRTRVIENTPVELPGATTLIDQNIFRLSNGQRYRGSLEVRVTRQGLTLINELPIEQYLYGVLPSEMPVSFPLEALKAQAVAARSYVIANLGSHGSAGFDVVDTQADQVYKGFDGENRLVNDAVDATQGLIITDNGQPVTAYYHASNGGYTESSGDIWQGGVIEQIHAKPDPYDNNDQYYNWTVTYSAAEVVALVNKQTSVSFARITGLNVVEMTASGHRVKKLAVQGVDTAGRAQTVTLANADKVRNTFGLRSALFTIISQGGGFTFKGSGFGHGVGMSQYGAAGMANQGYDFRDILQFYYTGVEVVSY